MHRVGNAPPIFPAPTLSPLRPVPPRHMIGPDGRRIRGTRHQRTQAAVRYSRLGR